MPAGGTVSMERFERKLDADWKKVEREIIRGVRDVIHDELMNTLPAGTPVDKGDMRRAWNSIPGAPRADEETVIFNTADHASVIDAGRKVVTIKRGKRAGSRMTVGSEQAPSGVVKPAIRSLNRKADRLLQRVLQRVDSRV